MLSVNDKVAELTRYGINVEVGDCCDCTTDLWDKGIGIVYLIVVKDVLKISSARRIKLPEWIVAPKLETVVDNIDNEDVIQWVDIAYTKMLEEIEEKEEHTFMYSDYKDKAKVLPKFIKLEGVYWDKEEMRAFGIDKYNNYLVDTETFDVYKRNVVNSVETQESIGGIQKYPRSISISIEMAYRLECRKNKNVGNISRENPYGE